MVMAPIIRQACRATHPAGHGGGVRADGREPAGRVEAARGLVQVRAAAQFEVIRAVV